MRNLLSLAALGLIVFLGLGWYLGWYRIQTAPTGDGHQQIEINLNTNKIKNDLNKGESKVHDWLNEPGGNQQSSSTTPGTITSFRAAGDGTWVFPASSTPAPSGGPMLPTPR